MSLAVLTSRALVGLAAPEVSVEVHLANGLPAFALVGLPDVEVREARDRVRAALQTSQFEFPQRRITVNLAPADLPKEGGLFDLAIALGILAASGQIPADALAQGIDLALLQALAHLWAKATSAATANAEMRGGAPACDGRRVSDGRCRRRTRVSGWRGGR